MTLAIDLFSISIIAKQSERNIQLAQLKSYLEFDFKFWVSVFLMSDVSKMRDDQ